MENVQVAVKLADRVANPSLGPPPVKRRTQDDRPQDNQEKDYHYGQMLLSLLSCLRTLTRGRSKVVDGRAIA